MTKISPRHRSLSQVEPSNKVLARSVPIGPQKVFPVKNPKQRSVDGIHSTDRSAFNSVTNNIPGDPSNSVSYMNQASFFFTTKMGFLVSISSILTNFLLESDDFLG